MGSLLPDTSWLMAPPAPQVAQEDSKRASNHPKPIHTIDSILNGSLNNQREQEFALPSAGVMQYSSKSIPLAQSAPNQTAQGFALPPVGFGQNSSNVVPIFRPVPLLHSRNSAFTLTKTAIALPARRSTGTAKQTRNARPREPTRLLQDAPNHGRQQQPPAVATPGSSIFPHPSLLHHYHMSYMQFGLHQLNCAVLASQHNALLWNATNSSIARAPAVLPLPPSRVDSTPSTRLGQHLTTFPQTGPKHVFNPQTSRAPSFVNVTGFTEHQIIRKPNPFGPPSFNQLCSTTAQPPPTTRSSSDASNELESSTNHAQHQATILDPPLSTSVHTPLITRITSDASNELAPNRREPLESLTRPAIGAESNLLSYIEHLPPTPFIQLPDAGRTEPDTLTLNQAQPIDQPVFIEPRSSPENIIAPAAPTPVPILEPPPLCLPLFIDTSAPGPSHRAPLPSPASAFAMLDRAQKTRAKSHRSLNRFWKCQFRWRRDSRKACSWSKREEAEYKRRTQDKLDRHNLRMERADREEQEARAILCLSPLSPNAPMPQLPFVLRKKVQFSAPPKAELLPHFRRYACHLPLQ